MGLPYAPSAVANEFLERAGKASRTLTPMQLLKLAYIAHGWNLAVTHSPLFDEPVQAWKYGPVIPSLFHEFKEFGGDPITKLSELVKFPDAFGTGSDSFAGEIVIEKPFLDEGDKDRVELIDWVWSKYGAYSGSQLSKMTHEPGTPWSNAVADMKRIHPEKSWVLGWKIENDEIEKHFNLLWEKVRGHAF